MHVCQMNENGTNGQNEEKKKTEEIIARFYN